MDLETNGAGSFLRRHSSRSSNAITPIDDDRDDIMGNGSVVPIPANALATTSLVSPSTLELIPPLSTEAIIHSDDKNQENKRELPWVLDCSSHLIHLAVFGILGVLTRYLLQKLFGPGVIGLTSDQSVLYLDLPSNMVGSFLMGWLGIVFKDDISRVSDSLAVGLTTGYLGSLTTYSGWNQKMLDLSAQGKWVIVVFGFPLGFILADYSIVYGIRTAQSFKRFMGTSNVLPLSELSSSQNNSKVNNFKCHFAFTFVLLVVLGLLWGVSGALETRQFDSGGSGAQLWLACIVGPFGVWLRYFLACRLNGHGLGQSGLLNWVPFGTLIANVSATCVMAALATLMKVGPDEKCKFFESVDPETCARGKEFGRWIVKKNMDLQNKLVDLGKKMEECKRSEEWFEVKVSSMKNEMKEMEDGFKLKMEDWHKREAWYAIKMEEVEAKMADLRKKNKVLKEKGESGKWKMKVLAAMVLAMVAIVVVCFCGERMWKKKMLALP